MMYSIHVFTNIAVHFCLFIYIDLIDAWKMGHTEKQSFVRIKMDTFQIGALI